MLVQFATRRSRHVLLTGATGFLGTALLEALLRHTDARISVLVRPTGTLSAHDRIHAVLLSDAFAPLRAERGPLMLNECLARINVIPGDLAGLQPRAPGARPPITLPSDIDTVIHSASSVSFDDDLETALATNVEGPAALYRALSGLTGSPHVIHISTAYVNAGRVRVALERPVNHDIDWRLELAALRDDTDLRTNPLTGRRHAQRRGWTDTYTFSKALGERVAEEEWAGRGHHLTVLRPAIIESALARPYPGWLDGFKVADPLISAYAEGRLTDFPGRGRAAIDLVPVDAVVDTTLAAAARPPLSGRARYLHVASSRLNPLRLDELKPHVDTALNTYGWPGDTPPTGTRPLRFHTRAVVRAGLRLARARLLAHSAWRGADARSIARGRALDRLSKYVDLYAPYTCNPTTFDATAASALLDAHRQGGASVVELSDIDWSHYLTHVHVPALGRQRRWWPHESAVAAARAQALAVSRVTTGGALIDSTRATPVGRTSQPIAS